MEISKEEFIQWKNSDVTKDLMLFLKEIKEDYLNQMRSCVGHGDLVKAAEAHGYVRGIESLLLIEYDEISNSEETNEHA